MTPTLAIQLRFGIQLINEPLIARRVAEILMRPCFRGLTRLSARWNTTWAHHTEPRADAMIRFLTDKNVDAAYLDAKHERKLVAMIDVENGSRIRDMTSASVRYVATLLLPLDDIREVVAATCDLATCLNVATGYIALEPEFAWAHDLVFGSAPACERPGVGPQRLRERRAREWYADRVLTELTGVEWGTFCGAAHFARLDLNAIRASRAFARVQQLAPDLAYLQVTHDPTDDLTLVLEERLVAARQVLASVLMPVERISLT